MISIGENVPETALTIIDPEFGLLGYFVIDQLIEGKSCGGIRISPDLDLDEIQLLARCMTLKFGFAGKPVGGAKAGILISPGCGLEERAARIRRFGEWLAPFMMSGSFVTGTDMGSTAADLNLIYRAAGMKPPACGNARMKSAVYTAMSIFVNLEAAAETLEIPLAQATASIQGFGAVGSALAEKLASQGVRIIAISTREGTLYREDGLDVQELLALREQYGERLVHFSKNAARLTPDSLLKIRTDFLAPCAGHETIHMHNADEIQSRIVCGGANYPVQREAEEPLHRRGILSMPHFAAGSGAVIGGKLETAGFKDAFIEEFIRRKYRKILFQLIAYSRETGKPVTFIAEDYARHRVLAMKQGFGFSTKKKAWPHIMRRLLDRRVLPVYSNHRLAEFYFNGLPGTGISLKTERSILHAYSGT